MTTIFNVDASAQAWQQPDAQRQPEKDFAHELAERHAQGKAAQQGSPDASSGATIESPSLPRMPETSTMALTLPEPALPQAEAQALAMALSDAEQLTQATVTPTGVTEALLGARVYGWHAMAQVYLSELSAADRGGDKASGVDTSQSSSPLAATAQVAEHAANTATSSLFAEGIVAAPQADIATPATVRGATDEAPPATIAELASADSSAAGYWPERSLRYTRQRDGGSVAWLRDFRLGDGEAARLVQFVLDDARAKGMALNKIMLNGREAWTSPNGIQGARHDG